MNEPERRELEALMSLLEDPDLQVFDTVSDRLIELGEEVVIPLERRWEVTLKPELQERIENVIKQIQFNTLQRSMDSWKSTGGTDLLYGAYLVARFQYPDLAYNALEEVIERIKRDIWLELNNELQTSLVVVTHDHSIARQMDRILVLENGLLKNAD